MTVICKIHKCVFCITIMIIFYAVILHLIAHPGTFLHRSHQYPTEPDAELQKNILWPQTYRKVTLLSCGVWQVNFCNYTFPRINETAGHYYSVSLKRGGEKRLYHNALKISFSLFWHMKATFQAVFLQYDLVK